MARRDGFAVAGPIDVLGVNAEFTHADLSFPKEPLLVPQPSSVTSGTLTKNSGNLPAIPRARRTGSVTQGTGAGQYWFELMHVVKRAYDFGFVLATQVDAIEVYNAYRKEDRTWSTFTNNAGAGVSLIGAPSLPTTVFSQGGIQMSLQVTAQGVSVAGTVDFAFDVSTIIVPVEIDRVVLFFFRPEQGYTETLEWVTDILQNRNGTETRLSPRANPRQSFDFEVVLDDGSTRTYLENFLFGRQSNVFGWPLFHFEEFLTVAASSMDTELFVGSTANIDFRVGGLAAVVTDIDTFDVLTITAINPTSIETSAGVMNAYPVGTSVMPVVPSEARGEIDGSRSLNNVSRIRMNFRTIDNDLDLADLSAFSSFNSKLLYDLYNFAGGNERFNRQLTILDNETGVKTQTSLWDRHRRSSAWATIQRGREGIWEHYQMLHALRGQQVAWYLPTNRDDLVPVLGLTSGSATLDVSNEGYTDFVDALQHKNVIRVTFNNGDPVLLRTVLSSAIVDSTRETLTLDSTWPSTVAVANIDRIEFVEKVRFDSDRLTIEHGSARVAQFKGSVRTVFN